MAETAKILSPDKTVVLPDMDAGCSLEDSCPPDQFAAFRTQHPNAIALTYINCSAAVKALSDVIVTRSAEHTSELQSLLRISYAVFCLNKKTKRSKQHTSTHNAYLSFH